MKYLVFLLLLPTLVLAQPPAGQQAPSFSEYKKVMQPAIRENLPVMQQNRDCLSKAESTADVETCMSKAAEMSQAIQKKLGGPAAAQDASRPAPTDQAKAPDDFEWNAETKAAMLKNIDMRIQFDTAQLECLDQSNTGEEMNDCMRSKAPKQ